MATPTDVPSMPNLSLTDKRVCRLVKAVKFAMVGGSGLFVNAAVLWLLVTATDLHYLPAAIVATQGSTTWNFALNELWVFRGRTAGSMPMRYVAFSGVNNAALLLRLPIITGLTQGLGLHYLASNLASQLVLFVVRFLVADGLIWRSTSPGRATTSPAEPGPDHTAHEPSLLDLTLTEPAFATGGLNPAP